MEGPFVIRSPLNSITTRAHLVTHALAHIRATVHCVRSCWFTFGEKTGLKEWPGSFGGRSTSAATVLVNYTSAKDMARVMIARIFVS